MFDDDLSTIEIVPCNGVLNNFCSELVLQVEADLESLLIEALCSNSYLTACTDTDIFNLIVKNQIWEVHVYLGDDLFRLKIINGEPKVLSQEMISLIFDTLGKNQRPLRLVVILKPDSLIEYLPCVVICNTFVFIVCWNGTLLVEEE